MTAEAVTVPTKTNSFTNFTADEKGDLVAFLKTLTGTLPHVDIPQMYAEAKGHKHGGKHQ